MPGILPMKVIKVGTSAQARIAQACDRCRSKKIRCDGVRPCCSQCSSVGFECKTSDKLSRRAFPRGYTESLEERVRSLEAEVRELKDLLDGKDEKIDMLTKIHPQASHPTNFTTLRRTSTTPSCVVSPSDSASDQARPKDELFQVQQSPYLLENGDANSYFAGTSSGKTFIDAFKHKVQERGRSADHIDAESLLTTASKTSQRSAENPPSVVEWKSPPRMLSDQMVNIFFQEWAPLFPVIHRPTFLTLYEEYTSSPESVVDKASLAQLNLVFGLALMSQKAQTSPELQSFETQWQAALEPIQTDQSMSTLQCLVLAQLYCIQRGDYTKLLTYKALAISIASRLGLQQSQKRFALGTLTCETRKKVFWSLYTIDSFSAVLLGLPQQIKDDDVHCEYPVDADDEYITERGFQPILPGESTRVSSALALFRATRILSKVLEEVYPALSSYDLSLQRLSALSDELDEWQKSLSPHLRLPWAQDKPTVGVVNSRSPLLSLTYYYIRSLIHRPAVCSSLGSRSSSSMMAMASSSKHIVQVLQLLTERNLSFSFCLNKNELLVLSGFGLLYQGLELDGDSKLMMDNQKTIASIIGILDQCKAPSASEFRRVACSFLPLPPPEQRHKTVNLSQQTSARNMAAPDSFSLPHALKEQFKAMTSKLTKPARQEKDQRRATEPDITVYKHPLVTYSQPTLTSTYDPASHSRSEPARSPNIMVTPRQSVPPRLSVPPAQKPQRPSPAQVSSQLNLDYLSFEFESPQLSADRLGPRTERAKPEPTDWERLLGSIDNGQTNIFDATYGGPAVEILRDTSRAMNVPLKQHSNNDAVSDMPDGWGPDIWGLTTADLIPPSVSSAPAVTESVLSFSSDDGPSSANGSANDGMAGHDWATLSATNSHNISGSDHEYRGIVMPDMGNDDGLLGQPWDPFLLGDVHV